MRSVFSLLLVLVALGSLALGCTSSREKGINSGKDKPLTTTKKAS